MDLAQLSDVQAALGRDLTNQEQARIEGSLIAEASDLVRAWCRPDGTEFPEVLDEYGFPVPNGVLARVVARMIARVFMSGETGANVSGTNEVIGPFQWQSTFTPDSTSGAPWLSASDKLKLKPFRNVRVQNFAT